MSQAHPGAYNVTMTAARGPTGHTATATIIITASASHTPNAPASILGLSPTTFIGIIVGVILAIVATGRYLAFRSKQKNRRK